MAQTTITHLSAETDAEMLRNAAKLVNGGWGRGAAATDKNGNSVNYYRPDAVCFCATGAISRSVMDGLGGDPRIVYTDLFEETVRRLYGYAVEVMFRTDPGWPNGRDSRYPENQIVDWNDDWKRNQQDVVDLLENAATVAASSTAS